MTSERDTEDHSIKIDILKTKLDVIDKIINLYPQLKKDKVNIVTKIIGKPDNSVIDDYVLEKIIIDDNVYYRDPYGLLLDKHVNIVGFYTKISGNKYYYTLINKNMYETIENNYKKLEELKL